MAVVHPIPKDAQGKSRIFFQLKWDAILDAAASAGNKQIIRNLNIFSAFEDGNMAYMARRIPSLMRFVSSAAEKLIDLEAVALLISKGQVVGYVDGAYAYALDGGIFHSGDDMTGTSGPFDEDIYITLDSLPPEIDALALMIDSVNGHPLGSVQGAHCRLVEGPSLKLITEFDIDQADRTGITHLFGFARRQGDGFEFVEVNHAFNGHSHEDILAALKQHL